MPQPDNRRERGAKTQTSQQTVAPQGQMSGTISPISGGAAAAAPVLQIGQQAQIKKTGAELYQAISGIAQGVQQGLKNYDEMYRLVSEAEYAEFETSYIQQKDAVKGDPEKMKIWMDNQTYKPNRVTAKRYWATRADINQKDYLDDQNDLWIADQKSMVELTTTQRVEYMNNILPTLPENSPRALKMQESLLKEQGLVAAETRKISLNALNLQWRSENTELATALRQVYPDVSGPNMETVFAAVRLGLVDVDPASGMILHKSTATMATPNSLNTEFIQMLTSEIGEYPDPDIAMESLRSAKLPLGITGGGGRTSGREGQAFLQESLTIGAKASDTDAIRALWSQLPSNVKQAETVVRGMINEVGEISNPLDRIRALETVERALDTVEGTPNSFDAAFGDASAVARRVFFEEIANKKDEAIIEGGSDIMAIRDDRIENSVSSVAEAGVVNREALTNLGDLFAKTGSDVSFSGAYHISFPFGVPVTVAAVLSAEDVNELSSKGMFSPVGVHISNEDVSEAVPLSYQLTPDGRIFSSNQRGTVRDLSAKDIQEQRTLMRELHTIDALRTNNGIDRLSAGEITSAMDRWTRTNPVDALGALSRTSLPSGVNLSEEAQNQIASVITEGNLARNPELRQAAAMAIGKNPSIIAKMDTRAAVVAQFGYLAPKDASPEAFVSWASEATARYNTYVNSEIKQNATTVLANIDALTPTELAIYVINKQEEDLKESKNPSKLKTEQVLFEGAAVAWERKYPDSYPPLYEALASGDVGAKSFIAEYIDESARAGSLVGEGGQGFNEMLSRISQGQTATNMTPQNANELSFGTKDNPVTAEDAAYIQLTEAVISTVPEEQKEEYRKVFAKYENELKKGLKLVPVVRNSNRMLRVDGESHNSFQYSIDYSELASLKIVGLEDFSEAFANSEFLGMFDPLVEGRSYGPNSGYKTGLQVLEEKGTLPTGTPEEQAYWNKVATGTLTEVERKRIHANPQKVPVFGVDQLNQMLDKTRQQKWAEAAMAGDAEDLRTGRDRTLTAEKPVETNVDTADKLAKRKPKTARKVESKPLSDKEVNLLLEAINPPTYQTYQKNTERVLEIINELKYPTSEERELSDEEIDLLIMAVKYPGEITVPSRVKAILKAMK